VEGRRDVEIPPPSEYGEALEKAWEELAVQDLSRTASDAGAEAMARKIAESPLVKCALFGADPNWGRIVSAAGYAGVPFEPDDVRLDIGEIRVFQGGVPVDFDRDAAVAYMKGADLRIALSVGNGPGRAVLWTCDLSYDYVRINAEYTT